jgi:hypothetical protein
MNRNETFRDYFRRARYDRQASAQLLSTAKAARQLFGWIVFVFAILSVWQIGYQLLNGVGWLSRSAFIDIGCLVINLLVYDKLGERIVALEVLAESPNQSTDPTVASGTPPAGQESRHP